MTFCVCDAGQFGSGELWIVPCHDLFLIGGCSRHGRDAGSVEVERDYFGADVLHRRLEQSNGDSCKGEGAAREAARRIQVACE